MDVAQVKNKSAVFHKTMWYRCALINYVDLLPKKPCKWKGDVGDYIEHVKTCHPQNFFELHQKYGKFRWKLPNHGDQQDIGIIQDQTDYYIYEMFYAHDIGKLYFSLNCLADEPNHATKYVFYLENDAGNTPKYIRSIINVNDAVKSIEQRSATTKLSESEVKECLQYYGHFIWKLLLK